MYSAQLLTSLKTITFVGITSIFGFLGCSGGSGGGGGGGGGGDTGSSTVESPGSLSINPLAASYPEGLAMSSFPDEVDSNPGIAAPGTLAIESNFNMALSVNIEPVHPRELLEDIASRLDGSASQCFEASVLEQILLSSNDVEYCFGFDYGIISGEAIGTGDLGQVNPAVTEVSNSNANFDEEDLKVKFESIVSSANNSGEACMIAVSKNLVSNATGKISAALQLFQGMLCQAKKSSLLGSLPGVGEQVDLSNAFSAISASGGVSIDSATLKRLADQNDNSVYKSTIGLNTGTNEVDIVLVHSPDGNSNENYTGVLYLQQNGDKNDGVSINYVKSGNTYQNSNIKYEVRTMRLSDSSGTSLFSDDGTINFSGQSTSVGNETLEGISYFAFDINPSNYEGSMAFWMNPGGSYSESARGFIFETTQNSVSGALSGCAYAGAYRAGSIRKAFKENSPLAVTGCFTPQINNGVCGSSGDNQGNQYWKQCFSQNSSSGVYEITTSASDGYEVLNSGTSTPPTVDLSGMDRLDAIE